MTMDVEETNPNPPEPVRNAKPLQDGYKRHLPHFHGGGKALFITMSTMKRWQLPEPVRPAVLKHCLHDHGVKLLMHVVVVMPDHVHLLFSPLQDDADEYYGLAEIMGGIKGASAHSINKLLARRGPVWQDESFDRVLRNDENVRHKAEYIFDNPVRKGLVASADDYPWLWREWIDGVQDDNC
jgi:REP element-mobilizing transposase RayT